MALRPLTIVEVVGPKVTILVRKGSFPHILHGREEKNRDVEAPITHVSHDTIRSRLESKALISIRK
jgi:hypothetical protein